MSRIDVKLPPFSGVAAGQTAVIDLPVNRRYHEIALAYAGVTLAQLNEIRVKINGQTIHRYSGVERDAINQFDGRAAAAGILTIPFDRYNLLQRETEEAFALNCGSVGPNGAQIKTFVIEIDILGAAAAPVMSMTATQSEPLAGGPGLILRVKKEARQLIDGLEIFDLGGGVNGNNQFAKAVNRVFFASANITGLEIRRDNFTIYDRSKALNDVKQLDGVRTAQAGYFVYDTTEKGYGAMPTLMEGFPDFRFILAASASGSMTMISELIGELGG